MRRLAPELAVIPFAGKRWPPHLMPDAPDPVTRRTPPLAEDAEEAVSLHPRRKRAARSPDETERRVRAAGAKPRQVELGRMLEEVRAAGLDLDPIGEVFDVDAVRVFLDRPHDALAKETHADDAYRAIAAAVWAQGLEIGPG